MVVVFLQFEGEDWNPLIKGHGWMDDTWDECDWFSSGFGYFWYGSFREYPDDNKLHPCNEFGQFTNLQLKGLQIATGQTPTIPPEITLLTSPCPTSYLSSIPPQHHCLIFCLSPMSIK